MGHTSAIGRGFYGVIAMPVIIFFTYIFCIPKAASSSTKKETFVMWRMALGTLSQTSKIAWQQGIASEMGSGII